MNIRMSASGFELSAELEKYAKAKMAHLAKRVPRTLRAEALCDIHFVQVRKKSTELNTCSFSLTVEGNRLRSEEATPHLYTALDIAVVHVEHQLADYLAKRPKPAVAGRLRRRLRLG